jgi:uncharacterized membrane protein YfcA
MGIYLPIAELSMNGVLLVALGLISGFLSGMFGIGGAFILTPLLVFIGVPPAIAVGTQACQLSGTSISGALAQWQKRQIDIRMGFVMLAGNLVGAAFGVDLFKLLKETGHIDLTVNLGYLLLLVIVGGMMMIESVKSLRQKPQALISIEALLPERPPLGANWPWKLRFPTSDLYISVFGPFLIGLGCGLIVGVLGVGGGFILIPAMLYMLRMPAGVVTGTSLMQIVFTTALATFLQATMTHSVDVVLAFFLLLGSVPGAQFGARYAQRLQPEMARFLLASLILLVALKLFVDLTAPPLHVFSREMRFPT